MPMPRSHSFLFFHGDIKHQDHLRPRTFPQLFPLVPTDTYTRPAAAAICVPLIAPTELKINSLSLQTKHIGTTTLHNIWRSSFPQNLNLQMSFRILPGLIGLFPNNLRPTTRFCDVILLKKSCDANGCTAGGSFNVVALPQNTVYWANNYQDRKFLGFFLAMAIANIVLEMQFPRLAHQSIFHRAIAKTFLGM